MKVQLKYGFVLEAHESLKSKDDFDLAILKAFEEMGYEVENVNAVEEDGKVVYLKQVKKLDPKSKEEVEEKDEECPKGCFGCDKCIPKKTSPVFK